MCTSYFPAAVAKGFLNTRITESPRRNIFDMKRSWFTGLACKNQYVLRDLFFINFKRKI